MIFSPDFLLSNSISNSPTKALIHPSTTSHNHTAIAMEEPVTVRRSVRRKLVQSTLFPLNQKPPEPNAKDDDKDDEQDDDYRPIDTDNSQKKRKKPKPKPKLTPHGKPSKNTTPKKKASANGNKGSTLRQVLTNSPQADTSVPDLRLEAKLSAEENSRMFAGREIHPFFSSWKAGKKPQEQAAESGNKLCTAKWEDETIKFGPIHVFENIQEASSSLDWSSWTFLGKDACVNYGSESSNLPVSGASGEPLNGDRILSILYPSGVSVSQNALSSSDRFSIQPENLQETSPLNSTSLANEQTICPQMPKDAEVDLEVDESVTFSQQAGIFSKLDTEPLSRFLQESMRSYYHSCKSKADASLWTYKYMPTKAIEVCGNDESVNFVRDWLHLWHQRRYQSRKDPSNGDKRDMQEAGTDDDDDYKYSLSDYDSEDVNEEDSLQNVLLITGPTGSGKSAAVYACAQEQGFEIFELNASHCRNGSAVKQYFGDTLGSLGFKRLSEDTAKSHKKTTKMSPALPLPNDKAADEMDDGVVGLITISDDEACNPGETSQKMLSKKTVFTCDKVQTLVLVEEVDILFPEDRGCIAAIQQIAEAARGPVILISNSDNPCLPDNFDRLHVSFSLPSPKELLCHLYTVCVTEGVNIHPLLLEKFIQSCNGDIRKTIMHLQFWFQSKLFRKDRKVKTGYGSFPFDLEVGHQILPKIMPWDFPSQLSELVENELAQSISSMEESSRLQRLLKKELHVNERQNNLDVHYSEAADYIEAKKMEMIKRNGCISDYSELEIHYNAEISDSFGSPMASSWQNGSRRKLIVMSSDSEDEDPNNEHPLHILDEAQKKQSVEDNNQSPYEFKLNENFPSTSVRKLVCSELEDSDDTCLNETCKSDISRVPESTFVPETAIENGAETMSGAVSSGYFACPPEVSGNNELKPLTLGVRRRLVKVPQNSDSFMNTAIPEAMQDLEDEKIETTIVNVMDECSRVDFQLKSKFVESSPSIETDTVLKLWKNLRERRIDLRQHATSEQLGVFEVVQLVSGLSNLISEADLSFNHQQKQCDAREPSKSISDEDQSSWYDEQIMMSTAAINGFCFYAKLIADVGSTLGCEKRVDLTSEMFASTTNLMALGKLSRLDLTKNMDIFARKELELKYPINDEQKSEKNTSLFNVIQSIVPAKISLALKGVAFSDYLSSLRMISRSEALRVSQGVTRRGRVRGSQHYLSRCTMLSPEDISLVNEGDFYRMYS